MISVFLFDIMRMQSHKLAKQLLRNPVNSILEEPNTSLKLDTYTSGLSALSRYSNLNTPDIITYAVWNRKKSRSRKKIEPDYTLARNNFRIEYWMYNPGFFATDKIVDRLSLYLSLRNEEDERVQMALDRLLEGVKW